MPAAPLLERARPPARAPGVDEQLCRLRNVLDTDVEAFNRAVREADLPAVLTEAVTAGR
jgi:hypothetical protein